MKRNIKIFLKKLWAILVRIIFCCVPYPRIDETVNHDDNKNHDDSVENQEEMTE